MSYRVCVLSTALMLSCSALPFPPAGPNAAPDPSVYGPYPVGVRPITSTDPGRPKPEGSPPSIVTEIWYPAAAEARGKAGVSYDVRPLLTDEQRAQIANTSLPLIETKAVRDA